MAMGMEGLESSPYGDQGIAAHNYTHSTYTCVCTYSSHMHTDTMLHHTHMPYHTYNIHMQSSFLPLEVAVFYSAASNSDWADT